MTTIQQSPHQQLPVQGAPITKKGGGDAGPVYQKGGDTSPVQQKDGGGYVAQVYQKDGQVLATAGTPVQQLPREQSWLSKNIKLVGILGGAAVGGAIGFLTLGPIGGLGGAAVGALAGYLLTAKRGGGGAGSAPPVPPSISTR